MSPQLRSESEQYQYSASPLFPSGSTAPVQVPSPLNTNSVYSKHNGCVCQFLLTREAAFTQQAFVYTFCGRLQLRKTLSEAAVRLCTSCNAHIAQSLKVTQGIEFVWALSQLLKLCFCADVIGCMIGGVLLVVLLIQQWQIKYQTSAICL